MRTSHTLIRAYVRIVYESVYIGFGLNVREKKKKKKEIYVMESCCKRVKTLHIGNDISIKWRINNLFRSSPKYLIGGFAKLFGGLFIVSLRVDLFGSGWVFSLSFSLEALLCSVECWCFYLRALARIR